MKQIQNIGTSGLILALAVFAASAVAVEPVNFEIRNNADLVALCSTKPGDPTYMAAIHFCHGPLSRCTEGRKVLRTALLPTAESYANASTNGVRSILQVSS